MKVLNILLYVAVVIVVVFAALDITSQASFSSEDKKAIAFASEKMEQQIDNLSFARVRKYNLLNNEINACRNQEGFDDFAKQLKLSRAISFNANNDIIWLENKLKDENGLVNIDREEIERVHTNLSTFVYNLNQVDPSLNFAAPMPYKSEIVGQEIGFNDLQGSDVAFWNLAKNMVDVYCLEVEENVLNKMISQIDCGESIVNNYRVRFASESKIIEPGEDYKADMLLTGEYFVPKIEVTSEDGDITYNSETKVATLVVNASAEDSEFDENGEVVKTWKATLKVPSMNGYETFNIERQYTIKK